MFGENLMRKIKMGGMSWQKKQALCGIRDCGV